MDKSLEKIAIVPDKLQPLTIFAVLGFLEEYAGRRVVLDGERIETFGTNEANQARRFAVYLKRLVDEYQLKTTIRQEAVGNCFHFYSRELTALIDSYYLKHGLTGSNPDGSPAYTKGTGVTRHHAGRMSVSAFPHGDREARLSYLIGAHERWGEQNSFRMAYGVHKVRVIKRLLHEVGSPNVVVVYPDPDHIPAIHQIAFAPTPELFARLNIEIAEDID